MVTPPYHLSRRFTAAGITALLALAALCPRPAWVQEPSKQERIHLDLRTPLEKLSELSLFGPAVEAVARTSDQGLQLSVPAGRDNVNRCASSGSAGCAGTSTSPSATS